MHAQNHTHKSHHFDINRELSVDCIVNKRVRLHPQETKTIYVIVEKFTG